MGPERKILQQASLAGARCLFRFTFLPIFLSFSGSVSVGNGWSAARPPGAPRRKDHSVRVTAGAISPAFPVNLAAYFGLSLVDGAVVLVTGVAECGLA